LAEFFLQRTRAETVAAYLPVFVSQYPSWSVLAKATRSELEMTLKPIGLWRRRAASLYLLAREMNRRGGVVPTTVEEVQQLPGVGQYIGNALLLMSHRLPYPLLDSGMARVLERYFGSRKLADIRDDPYLQALARRVVSHSEPLAANWAILDLAALICRSVDPKCLSCPLARGCLHGQRVLSTLERGHVKVPTGGQRKSPPSTV
jgi:A/G-specific adenine glycosylase